MLRASWGFLEMRTSGEQRGLESKNYLLRTHCVSVQLGSTKCGEKQLWFASPF